MFLDSGLIIYEEKQFLESHALIERPKAADLLYHIMSHDVTMSSIMEFFYAVGNQNNT